MRKMKGILCSIVLATTLPAFANDDTVILDETGVRNLRLETEVVEEADFDETAFALGRIEALPGKTGVISSRISGRVSEQSVVPGDLVTAGQIVVQIESRQPGSPPPTIPLKAPISGLVMAVNAQLGEAVEPDRSLVEITDLSQVSAIARVPEDLAGVIAPGTAAHIRIAALPNMAFEGKLSRFGTSVNSTSGTLDAIFEIENKEGRLRPGMRAEFALVLGKRENVLRVPRIALQGDASNRFLYVKHFDIPNAFIHTPVEVGAMNDRYVEILSGLFPADEVVTKGAYALSFAGGGAGISLKEALDAAHGHEHAADGSELTPEKAGMEKGKAEGGHGDEGHDHDHGEKGHSAVVSGGSGRIWRYVSGVLFLLLVASFFGKGRAPIVEERHEASPQHQPEKA